MWIIKTKHDEQLTLNVFDSYDKANNFLLVYILQEHGLTNFKEIRGGYHVVPIDWFNVVFYLVFSCADDRLNNVY